MKCKLPSIKFEYDHILKYDHTRRTSGKTISGVFLGQTSYLCIPVIRRGGTFMSDLCKLPNEMQITHDKNINMIILQGLQVKISGVVKDKPLIFVSLSLAIA